MPVFLAGAWQDQETGSHFAEHARQLLARHPDEGHADERRAPGLARSRGAHRSGPSSSTSTWRKQVPSHLAGDARARGGAPRAAVRRRRDARRPTASPTSPTTRPRCAPTRPEPPRARAVRRAVPAVADAGVLDRRVEPFPRGPADAPRPRGTSAPTARSATTHPSSRRRRPLRLRPGGVPPHRCRDARRDDGDGFAARRRTTGSRSRRARRSAT